MKTDDKIIDAIINLGAAVKELRTEVKELRVEVKELRAEVKELRAEVKELQKQQYKTNVLLAEHSRAILKLADGQDRLRADVNALRADVNTLRSDVNHLRSDVDHMRSDFNKYATSNNNIVKNHETRIVHLEEKNTGSAYIASEPVSKYKKLPKKRSEKKRK